MASANVPGAASAPKLTRGITLRSATALNMIDMIGVGPFITIPLVIQAMGGPQALVGWMLGAVFALCDGMIWAELGSALPGEGGSYHYLSHIFGARRWGRLWSFLYVWQVLFSAPLLIASGCIGLALYATFLWPGLDHPLAALGPHLVFSRATLVAIGACLLALALAYRQVRWIGRLAQWLWWGVLATIGWILVAGLTHFHAARLLSAPPHAFSPTAGFFAGLASAMMIAFYDFGGYETSNFLAGEVVRPERTLPRAIVISIVVVGVLYLAMNVSVLGVVPWRTLLAGAPGGASSYVISDFMRRIYGAGFAAKAVTLLILWTAFASVFSLLLGYSRVLYAAAEDGNFFRAFADLHPQQKFPRVALLALGVVAAAFCLFRLDEVIAALVVIKLVLQYVLQAVALIVWRARGGGGGGEERHFRMPWYPLPVLGALGGYMFLLFWPAGAMRMLGYGGVVVAVGVGLFLLRARRQRSWPLGGEVEG
ncbi:MAG: APC family permease [Terriglobales bacterium]